MKRGIVSVLMLTLILTSMLSGAFMVKQSFAKEVEDGLLEDDFAKSVSDAASPDKPIKQSPEQSQSFELPSQCETRGNNENTWNFRDASVWNNCTYVNGNNTRLVLGVDSKRPSSLVELVRIAANHQASIVNEVLFGGRVRALVVELKLSSATALVGKVQGMSLASYVEPDVKVQALFTPNDPKWSLQCGPQKIGADWAWNTTVGSHSVLVAVVDTGIDYDYPDLASNYAPLGYNWVYKNADPKDDFGHGAHCAGIIAAVLNNSVGIAGMSQVRIMAEKVLDSSGGGH